jgi:hypothetical protein
LDIQNLQLFINDKPVAIDGNGLVQLKAKQSGPIVAKAVAIRKDYMPDCFLMMNRSYFVSVVGRAIDFQKAIGVES